MSGELFLIKISNLKAKIEIKNLSFYYDDFKALDEIYLPIYLNKVSAVIGPSGCGKSTLLWTLNRMSELIPGTKLEGEIIIDEKNILNNSIDLINLRRKVGMVFQKPNPFPKTIFENVAYGLRIQGEKNQSKLDDVVEKSLKRSALWDEVKNKLNKPALSLSGGQQQRLCVARVLAVNPEVILMDEPCSALDPISTQKIEDLIQELRERYTVVIVTHNMQQAARISDYTAFLLVEKEGSAARLIEHDETDLIFTKPKDKRTENYITGRFG